MVSFTFDDVPDSALSTGAGMIEDRDGRATFYIAGGLIARRSEHWMSAGADDIVAAHQRGHEIGCHTFSHRRAIELDAAAMDAEIETNRRFFHTLDPSIRLANFAYPYGVASLAHKPRLRLSFSSARGILPGVNGDIVDLQFLRATPLIDCGITRAEIDRAFEQTAATGGWLIFYSHDVARKPSPYGCSPDLLDHALRAATRRQIPIVTVAEALRRAGLRTGSDGVPASDPANAQE
jgi:peptidoglycan/xylan/chitin deacetylase (PgdA/CDA1 family)